MENALVFLAFPARQLWKKLENAIVLLAFPVVFLRSFYVLAHFGLVLTLLWGPLGRVLGLT